MSQYFDNNAHNAVKDQIFNPLYGVELTDGLFRETFENNIDFLKSIDMDAMLYWFRRRAGEDAPGEPYRGHFEDNIKGQTAGLYLMGAGNTLRFHEDAELRRRMDYIVAEIKRCSEPDGYLMAVPKEEFGTKEYPHYVRIWLTYGLMAAARAGNPDAWPMLRLWQDWFNQCDDLPIIRYTNLAFQGVVASTALYNTPIGRWEDIDVTIRYYEEDWRLAQFIERERDAINIRKQPGREPHPHGTEIEAMEGYLDLYRATGKHYYLRAVSNFYEFYRKDWIYPGGGIAMCEFESAFPKCYWLSNEKHYNELCCSSFWLLLNQRYHRLFPQDESYVAEMEASIYNIGIANQNGCEDIFYFAHLDKQKVHRNSKVHCCAGVGTKMFGTLPEYVFSLAPDDLWVDIYSASTLKWQRARGDVGVTLQTAMPYGGDAALSFDCAPQTFTLHLRIPRWVAGDVDIFVNGEKAVTGKAGSYAALERCWQAGDKVTFTLPFAWNLTRYVGAEQVEGYDRYAFEYGPLLMAFKGPLDEKGQVVIPCPAREVPDALTPAGQPLHFAVAGLPGYEMVPYLEIGPAQTFTCFPLFEKRPITRMETKPAFRVAGKSILVPAEAEGDRPPTMMFWWQSSQDGTLRSVARLEESPVTGKFELGIRYDEQPDGSFRYMIGAGAGEGMVPDNLQAMELPAGTWAVFECFGALPAALTDLRAKAIEQYLPAAGLRHAGTAEMEVRFPGDARDLDYRCELWIPVVKD